MNILKKLFGKKESTDVKVEPVATVEPKVLPKEEEDIGVPADGDQVIRGE